MTDMHREAYLVPIIRPINVIDVWEHTPSDYYSRGEYPRHIRPVGPRCGDFDTALRYRDEQARCECAYTCKFCRDEQEKQT